MSNLDIFTSLDLEMNQPSGKIIQIGAVVGNIRTGEILDKCSIFVNPNEQLSEFIINLTGISQGQVDSGSSLLEAYEVLKEIHVRNDCYVNPCTWNGGDHVELLDQLRKEDPLIQSCFGRRWIDVKTLFISWRLANGQPIQSGLAKSMTKVGLRFQGSKHNALDDSLNTFKMFVKMLDLLKTNPKP